MQQHEAHLQKDLQFLRDLVRFAIVEILGAVASLQNESLTALCGGVLNSFHRFGLPALTPVILNLCMIAGAVWLSPHLQVPIMAMGWAILAAGVLQLLFQLPALRGLNLLTLPKWGWSHPDVRRVMKCCTHHVLPSGHVIPFCAYNVLYRDGHVPLPALKNRTR